MIDKLVIRNSTLADIAAIELLYPDAFPDEDLLPLVRDLLSDTMIATSIVGEIESNLVGHMILSKCGVTGTRIKAALLGPLAVATAWHGQGVGSELVRAGLRQLRNQEAHVVCVLGDPAFYSRLGFSPESLIQPPYKLPPEYDDAWQSQTVSDCGTVYAGELSVPPQWQPQSLWLP